jgi:hypothetical protein
VNFVTLLVFSGLHKIRHWQARNNPGKPAKQMDCFVPRNDAPRVVPTFDGQWKNVK